MAHIPSRIARFKNTNEEGEVKMVEQEYPELTSSHKNTKTTTKYEQPSLKMTIRLAEQI